jgi:hypothetical protein
MANYYVSRQNGNDANAGTSPGAAKATYSAGLGLLSAGDTLYVGPGIYRERTTSGEYPGGSGAGSETRIIGDPECQYLTSDSPGIVRITGCDSDDLPTSGTVLNTQTTNHIHFKNLHVDGASDSYAIQAAGGNQVWEQCVIVSNLGVQGTTGARPIIKDCLIVALRWALFECNSIKCVCIGGTFDQHTVEFGYHFGTIAFGSRGAQFENCYDQSFEGTTSTSVGSCYNCLAIGGLYGFNRVTGYNNIAMSSYYGTQFYTNTARQMIGALAIACYRGHSGVDGSRTYQSTSDSRINAVYTNVSNYSPVNSGDVNEAAHVGFSLDSLRHIQKAFEPLNTMPSGTVDTNFVALAVRPTGPENPYIPTAFEGTSGTGGSHPTTNFNIPTMDAAGKPTNPSNWMSPGPYYTNNSQSLDFTNVSGSEFSVRLDGYSGINFDLPISSSQAFTASVAVKYNVTSTPPKLIVSESFDVIIDQNFTPIEVSATGTGDQTGAWQTLTLTGSSDIDTILNIQLLQADGHPTGSSYAIFSNLQVNE